MTGSRFAAVCAVSLIAAAPLAVAQGDKSANRAKLSQPAPVNPRQTGNNTFQFALQNGMQVLVIPDHRAPVATQMLWFKVGAVDDPPGISGLAHFFEHMMFRGTKTVPGDLFSQTIAKNGGETNAFTDHDYTAFYEQIAKDRLPLAMKLEADRLANLDLSDSHVGPERDVVLEERRMRVENEPQSLMGEQMRAALHMSHPYGRPVIGWSEEVRRIDRVSAQNFYDHHYSPNNAILVIAGDVTPDEVRKMAQDAYGKVAPRELQPRAEFTEPPRLAETRMAITRADARVPIFSRIYRVPSYAVGTPGQAEGLETFAQLLGGDQTSVLYRVLVEQKKLASDAGAGYDGNVRDAAEFSVYAVPRPGVSLEALEKAVDQVLGVSALALPRDADLARAKTQLVASVTYRRDSQFALASAYGQALTIGLTVDDVNEWPARIRAVSAEGVRKAAQLLSKKQAVTGYLDSGRRQVKMRVLIAAMTGLLAVAPAQAANIQNIDLGKKAEVWFAEDHTVPIVSFNISLPAGSAYDPAGKAGLAAFAGAMIDEGAGNLDSKAFHEALANRAISFSARAERDYLTISISTLKENAPEALHLLQLALTHPRFEGEAMSRVRTQIIQSLQQEQAQPQRVAARGFMREFFGGHAYAHPITGEIESISAINAGDLKSFAHSHWVKNGLKVAVAGDITPAALAKLLGETFQPVSGAAAPALPNVGRLGAPGMHVIALPVPQPTASFGLPGIMRHDPDFIPGYVANYILGGGGFSSRLTDEVRVKRGLTYGISTSLSSYSKASVLQGSVATRADAIRQTVQVVKDTLAEFAKNGPTQQELDDAKTYLTGSFPLAFASNSGTAAQLGAFQRQNLDIGYVARRNAMIQAVTLADVKRVSKKLFDPARLTVVIGGSPAESGRGAPQVPRPPVRPAPAAQPPGTPPATGVTPPSKPADKPLAGPVTDPKAKKP